MGNFGCENCNRISRPSLMLIPPSHLTKYFGSLVFPVAVLECASDRLALHADHAQLLRLITQGAVFGIGSRSRIKRLRLSESVNQYNPQPKQVEKENPGAWRGEDSRTFERQCLSTGFVYRHHPRHCQAWAPPGERLDHNRL
ncbi:MAG: hypothetical protein ABFD89_00890 [Bryobacteraceae bacterium]